MMHPASLADGSSTPPATSPAVATVAAFSSAAADLAAAWWQLSDLENRRDSTLAACVPGEVSDDALGFAAVALAELRKLSGRNFHFKSETDQRLASAIERLENKIEELVGRGCWHDSSPAIHIGHWEPFLNSRNYRKVSGVHVDQMRDNAGEEYYAVRAADLERDADKRRLLDFVRAELGGELPTIAGVPFIVIPANHRHAWGVYERGRDYVPASKVVELSRHVLETAQLRQREREEQLAAAAAAAEEARRRERQALLSKVRELASDPECADALRELLGVGVGAGATE